MDQTDRVRQFARNPILSPSTHAPLVSPAPPGRLITSFGFKYRILKSSEPPEGTASNDLVIPAQAGIQCLCVRFSGAQASRWECTREDFGTPLKSQSRWMTSPAAVVKRFLPAQG